MVPTRESDWLGRHYLDLKEPSAVDRPRGRAGPVLSPGDIVRVVQGALFEGQAAASDARGQIVPEPLEQRDLTVESWPPGAGQPRPIGCRRCSAFGKGRQGRPDLVQGQPDSLGDPDEGHPPDGVPVELTLAAGAPLGADQAVTLVEPEGGDADARPVGDLPDGQQSRPGVHPSSFSHGAEPSYRFKRVMLTLCDRCPLVG